MNRREEGKKRKKKGTVTSGKRTVFEERGFFPLANFGVLQFLVFLSSEIGLYGANT